MYVLILLAFLQIWVYIRECTDSQEVTLGFVNKTKKSLEDNIGPRFLHDGADAITHIVTHLVNISIKK